MTDAEPQASATPFPPGGEKRVEDFIKLVRWNPEAFISKRNSDVVLHILSLDAELPPKVRLTYSLLSIENDVQENLLNLLKISRYFGKARGKLNYKFNIARSQFVSP